MSSLSSVYRVLWVSLPLRRHHRHRRLPLRTKMVNRATALPRRLLQVSPLSLVDLSSISSSTGPKVPASVLVPRPRHGIWMALCTANGSRKSRPPVYCTHCQHTSIRCPRTSWALLQRLCLPTCSASSSHRI